MKKMLLSVACIAALFMASCTGTSEKDAEKQATAAVEQIKSAATEADAKSIVEDAQAYVEKLINDGKIDEAKKYIDQIAPVVNEKFPALAEYIAKAQQAIDTASAAASAVSDAKDNAADAVEAAKDQAVEGAQDAVNDAVDSAKDAATSAVNDATDAANTAAQNAANAAADKVNDMLKK